MEVRYDDFWINGVSARSKGITTVNPLTPPPMASRRYNTYRVGSDADLIVSDESYNNIAYSITARVIGQTESLDNSVLYAFLQGAQTLRLSRLPLYEFRIKKVNGINPQVRNNGNEIIYQISFELAPWKYTAFEPAITLSSAGNVANGGTRYCKPKYKLNLSSSTGTGAFSVNGQQVTLIIPVAMGSNVLIVDSENQIAYDGGSSPQMRTQLTSGIYPWMNPGNNYVTFGGIVGSIEIQRNQRSY